MNISTTLINWYKIHKRDLPWRNTTDPYKIWVSEIILQQTRVNQGTKYYHQFIKKFPDIQSLGNANIDEVLKQWQGLGYYNRAKNMHHTAKKIINDYNGVMPENYHELIKLKGVGPYTAAAVASFAYNEPVAVVDGNVKRVLSRVFGIDKPINSSAGEKEIEELAKHLLNHESPGTHNQAIIEFGAIQCTPGNPDCPNCSFQEICEAYNTNKVEHYPVKNVGKKKKNRYFYYLVIHKDQHTYIRKRTNKDVWNSLYEFPLIECNNKKDIRKITQTKEWKQLFNNSDPEILSISKEYKHILSHQHIYAIFIDLRLPAQTNFLKNNFLKIKKKNLDKFAISRLIEKHLEQNEWE
ncbi:MAG: A/G-specific adenine glycosylase [Bacteroidota bacterium]